MPEQMVAVQERWGGEVASQGRLEVLDERSWFSIAAVQVSRFGPDGKVVERWGSSDELGMLQQLGVVQLSG